MILTHEDYKKPNETLYNDIQNLYNEYFCPDMPYTQKLVYENAIYYGFTGFQELKFYSKREFSAHNYIEYLGAHCDHIVLQEPYKSLFFDGIRTVILNHGNRIESNDTVILYLTKKP